jgi:acyl dehydratase
VEHQVRFGRTSRFFEDFRVGDTYRHGVGRTITTTDNIWFTLLTQNTAPIHVDHHYAAQTEFGRPLVNSALTLAVVTGQSVSDVSQNVLANLAWDEVRLRHPVFEGDTIYSQSEVLEKRRSKSRPNAGIVTVKTTGHNQDGKVVITFRRTVMLYRRGKAPSRPLPDGES